MISVNSRTRPTTLTSSPTIKVSLLQGSIFATTLAAYVLTMPRGITLEDAGLFQMVCQLGGISHPPGYPFFTGLCQALVPLFPTGVMAGNLMSAIFAALTCTVFYSCVQKTTGNVTTAWVAALAYGFSTTFWSQAIIIEVYTLASLFFVVCWRALLSYVSTKDVRYLYLTAFLYGLSLTNHWPLMLLSTPALVFVLVPVWRHVFIELKALRVWLGTISCFTLGLTPYLAILLTDNPAIALLGEIDTIDQLIQYIARSAYSDHHVIADQSDRLSFIIWLIGQSGSQLGPIAIPIILAGFVIGLRTLPMPITLTFVLMFLGSTLVLNQLLGFSYEFLYRAVFKPYPVISYLAVAFWFAVGVNFLTSYVRKASTAHRVLPNTLAIVLVASVAASNYSDNNRSEPGWVEHYGVQLLESLPPGAVYFARDDLEVGVLGYLHKVRGMRPDIELRNWENLVFSNRFLSPFAPAELQQQTMHDFLADNERPLFASSLPIYPQEQHGAYFRYTPNESGSAKRNPTMDPFLDYLLDLYITGLITDPHELHYAYLRLVSFTRQYVGLAITQNGLSQEELIRLQRLQSTFPGKLTTLEVLLPLNNTGAKSMLMETGLAAQANIPEVASKESIGLLYEYLGRTAMMAPADNDTATTYFEKSIAINPAPGNTSLCPLKVAYERTGNTATLETLTRRYPDISCK
jgi:hypothetical protein